MVKLHVGMALADRAWSGAATIASVVGIAAMRSWPVRPWRSALISSRMARVSPTMRRAQSSTRSPSGVKPWKREPRLHQQHAQLLLELLDAGRQRRLGDAAGLRRAAEMLLARQRQKEFELVDHRNILAFQRVTMYSDTAHAKPTAQSYPN